MDANWKMTDFRVEFQKYGENAGNYTGKVVFENGDSELFAFKLRPNMLQPFINLIAGELALSANSLVDRLQVSIGIKAAAVLPPTPQGQNVLPNYTLKADASPVA